MTTKTVITAFIVLSALNAEAKRAAPADVTPVVKDGISYSAPMDQMGCVVAKSGKTGQVLWFRQVYVVKYETELEKDVQDCFIRELKIDGRKLLVANERGGEFELNLDALSIKVLKGQVVIDRTQQKK